MSIQAVAWVLDHSPTRGSERLVLLSIANHADPYPDELGAFEAYPGIDTIAWECQIERARTVTDAVSRLVAGGYLERITNGAPDGRIPAHRRPNLYRILTRGDGVSCQRPPRGEPRGVAPTSDGVSAERSMGSAQPTPKPSEEPSENRCLDVPGATVVPFDPDADNPEGDAFARFWEAYPRGHNKGGARKAWPKAVRVAGDAELIIAGAVRFAADPNRDDGYTPHASTWLNAERWNDPPLPPRQRRGGGPARRLAAPRRTGTAEVDRW